MEDRKPYTLKEPITFGSDTITELRFRKPKAKDFRGFPAGPPAMDDILTLISRLSGQPTAIIDELGAEDLEEVSAIVGDFMPAGPPTGAKPSRS